MRIGTVIPHLGAGASPAGIVRAAQRSEELGYDSLWVAERVLYPVDPQTPYPGTTGGPLPDVYRRVFSPIETLTWAAAHTKTIALGTSVLVMPYHNPVLVARQLTTLDVLSGGRLRVGLGQGWSKDELDATGAPARGRDARADEFIAVLLAMWGDDPVEFEGEFFRVPRSIIQPKPIQQPRPPLYLAAYTPGALGRMARLADGWLPTGVPLAGVGQMMGQARQMAQAAGRDGAALELIVLAHCMLADRPQGPGRGEFAGSLEEIREDVEAARGLGASEIILSAGFSPLAQSEEGFLQALEQLRHLA
ncbi:MAG: LLM class F420-dependent oxidoreductase [Chloroflexi bacterium]|nr:LLM class F420-dependent oxidoreductase [Chloroflexota bacterium]